MAILWENATDGERSAFLAIVEGKFDLLALINYRGPWFPDVGCDNPDDHRRGLFRIS